MEVAPNKREFLELWQAEIDKKSTHVERREEADRIWPRKRALTTFKKTIGKALADMVAPHSRCMFCEDNATAEVEHFWPRALFPRLTFEWLSFLYACGPCNRKKGDRFPIVSETGALEKLEKNDFEPHFGRPGWLNPRHEDPMAFLKLDLVGETFEFGYIPDKGTVEYLRAHWTVKELGLNERGLPGYRATAYEDYALRLKEYVQMKREGKTAVELSAKERSIARRGHLTVFREIQRQWQHVPDLRPLFLAVPEMERPDFPNCAGL